jgi:transposase
MGIKKGRSGRKDVYEAAFKRKLCEELLGGMITAAEITKKYNIPGSGTVIRWLKRYEEEQAGLTILQVMAEDTKSMGNDNGQPPDCAGQVAALQKELGLAKLRATVLETMIDVAEQEFKIEIRKKSGTKPLEG